jgi:pimeloyl-ACP methyl ester carboxylesterase
VGIPVGFEDRTTEVRDVAIHYVRGGQGPTLLLLHGYPQTWYMWRKVLPELSQHYTVIAPDLRGAGGSDAPDSGYDKKTLAADMHGLLTQLGLSAQVNVVGHDIGTMVAFAYAAAHRDEVTKLVLTEAPIPDQSLYAAPALTAKGPAFWNFGYFNLPFPEDFVRGRERLWVDRFTRSQSGPVSGISEDDVREYAGHLEDPAHLRASFEYFRAIHQDIVDNAKYGATKLAMPVLALGARGSLEEMVPNWAAKYAISLTAGVVENSGHWLFEEQPAELTARILQFLQPPTSDAGPW